MDFKKLAIAGGVLFAIYKFSGNDMIKGGVISLASVIIAKQIPVVQDYI